MNRRNFFKFIAGTVCAIYTIPLLGDDPIVVLQNKGEVHYKGIDWRLDYRQRYGCDQLYGSASLNNERFSMAMLFDPEQTKDGKRLRFSMDIIAKRFHKLLRRVA